MRLRALCGLVIWSGLIATSFVSVALGQAMPVVPAHVKTVWVIVMENQNWSSIKGSRHAPYMNGTLLPMASHAEQYFNPPNMHPSLPNYLGMEAGTNFGILDDHSPAGDSQ